MLGRVSGLVRLPRWKSQAVGADIKGAMLGVTALPPQPPCRFLPVLFSNPRRVAEDFREVPTPSFI